MTQQTLDDSTLSAAERAQLVAQQQAFERQIQDMKAQLERVEKQAPIAAAVDYWRSKQRRHFYWLLTFLVIALLLAGGTLWLAYLSAHSLFTRIPLAEVEVWKLIAVFGPLLLGIWLTRLATKIFVSNLHLLTDADERVTMINTYLALVKEGAITPGSDESKLVLGALFRPSTYGYINEEGPQSHYQWLFDRLLKPGKAA